MEYNKDNCKEYKMIFGKVKKSLNCTELDTLMKSQQKVGNSRKVFCS